jgi:DNA-binding response OmpR family regulator
MRILLAEHDAPLADFLHQRLQEEHFSVQVVSNKSEAQRLAVDQPYDLVLLDLDLPGEDGLDVRAVLRRGNRPVRAVLQVDDLELDRLTHLVQRHGHSIELSPKEFALLEFLMRQAGQPVSRSAIVEQVWKLDSASMTNVVDVYINYLRRKVDSGHERPLIRTIRGVGYQIGGNGQPLLGFRK